MMTIQHYKSQRHEGKIALITGGSSGIGLATAKRFLAEGAAHVFITGRRQAELDAAVAELGSNATAIRSDISKPADLDLLYRVIEQQAGHLDILFANAGGGEFQRLGEITEESVDKYLGINIKGTLFTVQKALPLLHEGSSIILNGSMVSIQGIASFSVYSATKAAIRSFARSWSVDLKGRNIRVNVVSPGTIITPAYKNELGLTDEQIAEMAAHSSATTPLGRPGTPDEIARSVSFLASDDSSYITGIELFVDGGASQI